MRLGLLSILEENITEKDCEHDQQIMT